VRIIAERRDGVLQPVMIEGGELFETLQKLAGADHAALMLAEADAALNAVRSARYGGLDRP
jgi:hypothetical protein